MSAIGGGGKNRGFHLLSLKTISRVFILIRLSAKLLVVRVGYRQNTLRQLKCPSSMSASFALSFRLKYYLQSGNVSFIRFQNQTTRAFLLFIYLFNRCYIFYVFFFFS